MVFITNAPRPSGPIVDLLDRLGVVREAYDAIVSSGLGGGSGQTGRPRAIIAIQAGRSACSAALRACSCR